LPTASSPRCPASAEAVRTKAPCSAAWDACSSATEQRAVGGFAATCFGPGVAPEGQRVRARFDGDMLILELGQGREARVFAADVRLSAGGFDGRQMLLSWSGGAGDWSVLPADPAALERLAGSAPATFRAEVERWRCSARTARRGLRRTWLVLGVLLASPL